MAETCHGVVSESDSASNACETSSRAARRRRMEIRRFKFVSGVAPPAPESPEGSEKQKKAASRTMSLPSRELESALLCSGSSDEEKIPPSRKKSMKFRASTSSNVTEASREMLRYGVSSVCGRRRDMEDAVSVHPSFCRRIRDSAAQLHYLGVYDGHGCSHVATKCREWMHELVKDEVESMEEWKTAMERSFVRMDKEVVAWGREGGIGVSNCRCELQTPESEAAGSTAVVAVIAPDKIVVANCGDSRAVLCRNGKAFPLSVDHKPDRPDELNRIQEAGGRVIYWDGPRVLGVLAMSRAIGDNYLKPYVSCVPEVTITDRTVEDECLILASDGLWDVVSNETACGVARMCLRGKRTASAMERAGAEAVAKAASDRACSDASILLTKLALARHSADNYYDFVRFAAVCKTWPEVVLDHGILPMSGAELYTMASDSRLLPTSGKAGYSFAL
ncbi:hypothetical protein DVH24_038592 [Malus domestica]|uniref:protein-serine/threonine phosphatase n=1 Tax=Malus domestica TaxID=3750 RepID=A0A498KA33_MALDO|nr:hypothetical protein DVH24_038592 [Malus domestica]